MMTTLSMDKLKHVFPNTNNLQRIYDNKDNENVAQNELSGHVFERP